MTGSFSDSIKFLLLRDLNKLASELNQYSSEESIWNIQGKVSNSAGNLCLHLCGNLQYYIGTILGNKGYVRNRENEFAARNIPRSELISEIEKTKSTVENVLSHLTEDQIQALYPADIFGTPMSTQHFLIHLSAHLGYHLGQINYHRRLIA